MVGREGLGTYARGRAKHGGGAVSNNFCVIDAGKIWHQRYSRAGTRTKEAGERWIDQAWKLQWWKVVSVAVSDRLGYALLHCYKGWRGEWGRYPMAAAQSKMHTCTSKGQLAIQWHQRCISDQQSVVEVLSIINCLWCWMADMEMGKTPRRA